MDDRALTPRWEVWSPSDVSRWVATSLDLPQYAEAFTLHDVDGPTLLELTDETLENPLGIGEALKRKKILGHVKLLKIRNLPPEDTGPDAPPSRNCRNRGTPRSDGASGHGTPRQAISGARSVSAGPAAQDHRVRRNRSAGSVGNKTPRSVSASSDRSLEGTSSMKSLGEDASLYYTYTNPNQRITSGLVSHFGIDSRSFSRTGSFPRSTRKPGVFPGVQTDSHQLPGPDCYQIGRDSANRMLRTSPRATIGRSPRNTVEYVLPTGQVPGVGKYDPPGPRTKAFKGNTFTTTPRLNYTGRQERNWLSVRRGPGPSDYRPHRGYDSTFQMN